MKLDYRPDIDGLRAIAVLSVIVFHINESWLPGGFLGVDIFFVISGYLITLLLLKEIVATGKVNFRDFFSRRIRRIIPALLFVLSATLLAGFVVMTPGDYRELLYTALSSALSAANIHFFITADTGYFAADSHDVPLLHLWSLGIEEQYYLVWPLLLLIMIRHVGSVNGRLWMLGVTAILSLGLAQVLLRDYPTFVYYMLPTRAWELLAGCIAALLVHSGRVTVSRFDGVLAATGLALLSVSFVAVTGNDAVPGVASVPAVLGSTLLILHAQGTVVGKLLAVRPMVAVGLLSYSAYLWHWPILAFLDYSMVPMTYTLALTVLSGTFIAASISYRYIEKPLRKYRNSFRNISIRYLALPLSVLVLFSVFMERAISQQWPLIFPWVTYAESSSSIAPAFSYDYNCQYSDFDQPGFNEDRCVHPAGGKPAVLLAGDSNAAHFTGFFREMADDLGFVFRNATQSSCPPMLPGSLSWFPDRWHRYRAPCEHYREVLSKEVARFDAVLIAGTWDSYDALGGEVFHRDTRMMVERFRSSVGRVVLIGKVPRMHGYDAECEARSVRLSFIDCGARFEIEQVEFSANLFLKKLADEYPDVDYIDVRNMLCNEDRCSPYLNGKPVYFNAGHLSMEGGAMIAREMILRDTRGFRDIRRVIQAITSSSSDSRIADSRNETDD